MRSQRKKKVKSGKFNMVGSDPPPQDRKKIVRRTKRKQRKQRTKRTKRTQINRKTRRSRKSRRSRRSRRMKGGMEGSADSGATAAYSEAPTGSEGLAAQAAERNPKQQGTFEQQQKIEKRADLVEGARLAGLLQEGTGSPGGNPASSQVGKKAEVQPSTLSKAAMQEAQARAEALAQAQKQPETFEYNEKQLLKEIAHAEAKIGIEQGVATMSRWWAEHEQQSGAADANERKLERMKGYLDDLKKQNRFRPKSTPITVNERPHNYREYKFLSDQGWRVPFNEEVSGNDSADAILKKTIWISNQTLPEDETGLNKGQMYEHGTVGVVDSVAVIRGEGNWGGSHALHAITTSPKLGADYTAYGSLTSADPSSSEFVDKGETAGGFILEKPVALYRTRKEKKPTSKKRPFLIKTTGNEKPSSPGEIRNWIERGEPWPPPARPKE